jgi:hypothetical protein
MMHQRSPSLRLASGPQMSSPSLGPSLSSAFPDAEQRAELGGEKGRDRAHDRRLPRPPSGDARSHATSTIRAATRSALFQIRRAVMSPPRPTAMTPWEPKCPSFSLLTGQARARSTTAPRQTTISPSRSTRSQSTCFPRAPLHHRSSIAAARAATPIKGHLGCPTPPYPPAAATRWQTTPFTKNRREEEEKGGRGTRGPGGGGRTPPVRETMTRTATPTQLLCTAPHRLDTASTRLSTASLSSPTPTVSPCLPARPPPCYF